ncbi:MAG: hypothetical protein ACRBCI_14840 [Cellvibrionaceae bacterium]
MIVINDLRKLLILFAALTLSLGCSAQKVPKDPNNQLIEGPFSITTEWQTIKFDKPLKSSPHIQSLDILLDIDKYELVEGLSMSEYRVLDLSYKRLKDSVIVKPEVVLVDQQAREYRVTFDAIGTRYTKLGDYFFLGYGTSDDERYYFPKDAEFVSIRVRANKAMTVTHLNWIAAGYFKRPDRKWDEVHPSKIISIE